MRSWVGFEIIDRTTNTRGKVHLGEIDEVYRRGITIGGFTDCSARLHGPSAEGVKARFFGASHHRFLAVESAPASSPLSAALGKTERVDFNTFEIGDFSLRVLEVNIDATIYALSAHGERFATAVF
jgi:hypothetical protein